MGTKLYVGNLKYETTERELRDIFSEVAPIVGIEMMMDQDTGKSRGYAFIQMATPDDAEKAINALNGTHVGGRELRVSHAKRH